MKYWIKILTTNSKDLKTGLVFFTETKSYGFNFCDGFQKIASFLKLKFHKINTVFFSSSNVDYISGFPGFYLSARDGSPDKQKLLMDAYGPSGIKAFIQKCRGLIINYEDISTHEFSFPLSEQSPLPLPQPHIQHLNPQEQEQAKEEEEEQGQGQVEEEEEKIAVLKDASSSCSHLEEEKKISLSSGSESDVGSFSDENLTVTPVPLYSTASSSPLLSFILLPKPTRGKFLIKNAKELNVPPRLFKELSSGKSVTLSDNSVVHPNQVLSPAPPAQVAVLLVIPSLSYLHSLFCPQNQSLFQKYFSTQLDGTAQVQVVYHSVDIEVFNHQKYRDFCAKFGEGVKHVIDSEKTNGHLCSRFQSAAFSRRLNKCNSILFKNLCDDFEVNPAQQEKDEFLEIIAGEPWAKDVHLSILR